MANENQAANGQAGAAASAQLTIQKIYLKDASFEVPGAPQIFQEQGQPQFKLELAQRVQQFAENQYEVVLGVTLTCELNDKTVFIAEIKQAGIFGLEGFEQDALQAVLGTYCPQALFPYARSSISELVLAGGVPPFVLQPINFDQLYAEQMRRRNAEAQSQGLSGNA